MQTYHDVNAALPYGSPNTEFWEKLDDWYAILVGKLGCEHTISGFHYSPGQATFAFETDAPFYLERFNLEKTMDTFVIILLWHYLNLWEGEEHVKRKPDCYFDWVKPSKDDNRQTRCERRAAQKRHFEWAMEFTTVVETFYGNKMGDDFQSYYAELQS